MTSRTGKPLRPHRHAAPYLVPGAPPGTLTPIAGSAKPVISILTINRDVTRPPETANDLSDLPHVDPDGHDMLWIRVTGFGDISPIKTVGETYGIPSLALEDAMSPGWRAEMTDEGDWLFFVLPVPPADFITEKSEHLGLFFHRNLVITFEESPTLLIDRFWQQLIGHKPDEKITHQAGYYAYRVIDTIIDRFFPLLDTEYNTLADLEDALDTDGNPGKKELRQLHRTKRDILYLKRVLFPYKELGTALRQRSQIEKSVELKPYLKDLVEHIVQAEEFVNSCHEIADSLSDIYQNIMSNKMNDIIRILTIISTILMPLTFIAGLYGMNFNVSDSPWNMPELHHPYGYPITLLLMLAIALGMIWFFKKKDWL